MLVSWVARRSEKAREGLRMGVLRPMFTRAKRYSIPLSIRLPLHLENSSVERRVT